MLLVLLLRLLEQVESDTFGDVCGVFYGAGGCWSAARLVYGLEGNVWPLKCAFAVTHLHPASISPSQLPPKALIRQLRQEG